MARFKIEATWDDVDGEPVVDVELARLERETDKNRFWKVIGNERITDLEQMTPKRVRAHALTYLAAHAGMEPEDSFELQYWQRAGRDALERIEAAVAR